MTTALNATELTCRERIEATLVAVSDAQRRCNAFTAIRIDEALAEADALDRIPPGERGPLHGMPVAVKDLFDVTGLPTTGGCAAYNDHVAFTDAAVVKALEAAGAVIVAKTNQHELGAGATGLVSSFGPVANPIAVDRLAGGSSSGSAAAVASGAVPLAIGSDTGGSIRIPASFCSVTGLRPTPGRISLAGAQAMSPGYDSAGPLARSARDCASAFAVLSHSRPGLRTLGELTGVRVGLPEPYYDLVHPGTRRAVEDAATTLEELGAVVEWIAGPGLDPDFEGFRHVWADFAHHHRDVWDSPAVSDEVAALLDLGRRMTGLDYAASRTAADDIRHQFANAFEQVDVLLTPTTPYPSPRAADDHVDVEGGVLDVHEGAPSRLTVPINEAGVPAIGFPVGKSTDGFPLGAQLIGPPHADEHLLAIVILYQDATQSQELR